MSNLDQVFEEQTAARLDPISVFAEWYAAAQQGEPNDPDAACLATVGPDGTPSARMVLLKDHGPDGFVFYTNLESEKGAELAENPKAALCFHWKSLRRQVRINGSTVPVSGADADAYFATRPRGSQISAWASAQSQPLASRESLEKAIDALESKYSGKEVPRPPHWSGYRILPDRFEFWLGQISRRHDRMQYTRTAGGWHAQRLYP